MPYDPFAQPNGKVLIDPKIPVGKSKISKSYLDTNVKISEYFVAKRCKSCNMVMDAGEGPVCKYCNGDF